MSRVRQCSASASSRAAINVSRRLSIDELNLDPAQAGRHFSVGSALCTDPRLRRALANKAICSGATKNSPLQLRLPVRLGRSLRTSATGGVCTLVQVRSETIAVLVRRDEAFYHLCLDEVTIELVQL